MQELEFQHVTKYYDNNLIVEDISFSVEKGEVFGIVGPSGAGKTTLLRLLSGLDAVSSGRILYKDEDITYKKANERHFAMIFQDGALFPHLTVQDNIIYGLKTIYPTKQEITKHLEEIASRLHIQDLLNRYPSSLSAGEKQRVGIARAFIRNPEVVLLDEPFSNLDLLLKEELKKDLFAMQKELKQTMVLVTHDQNEALELCNHILVMNEGKMVEMNTPQVLYQQPSTLFTAQFIGYPPINCFSSQTQQTNRFTLLGKKVNIDQPLPENIRLCLRCEAIQEDHNGNFEGIIQKVNQWQNSLLLEVNSNGETIRFFAKDAKLPQQTIKFSMNLSELLLFDTKSGKRIPFSECQIQ